jgi:methylated-DNA-protein-cysteine methyltransferase-like protein
MTYGQIATLLGAPRAARAVGYALRASKNKDVPWQRVINSQGGISARSEAERPLLQEQLLLEEGVVFGKDGTCDLKVYRWEPDDPDAYDAELPADLPFR